MMWLEQTLGSDMDLIVDNLYLSGIFAANNLETLLDKNISSVLTVGASLTFKHKIRERDPQAPRRPSLSIFRSEEMTKKIKNHCSSSESFGTHSEEG